MSETGDKGWLANMRAGLQRTRARLDGGLSRLMGGRRLDDAMIEALEDTLIAADFGPHTAAHIVQKIADRKYGHDITDQELRRLLAAEVAGILTPVAQPLNPTPPPDGPRVILVIGVNGSGKTTSIAKLAHQFINDGHKTLLAAGDTFRAAAVEQLCTWGQRIGADVVSADTGADAAGLAHHAIDKACAEKYDILVMDTAGRLHNKSSLMDELGKIRRVIARRLPGAPHDVILVLDAGAGQNALDQIDMFHATAQVTGLIMTKLDGTARGGILVAAAERFGLPIHAIGVGEKQDDLRAFDPTAFANALTGAED